MNAARENWETAEQRKKDLPGLINRTQEAVDKLNQALEESDAHSDAVEKMKGIKAEIIRENKRIERIRDDQVLAINRACAAVFGKRIFTDAKAALDIAHKAGKIPPKVSAGLLDELIEERQKCICGRDLHDCEIGELKSLRSITLEDAVAETASDLRSRLPLLIETDEGSVDKIMADQILKLKNEAIKAEKNLVSLKQQVNKLIDEQPEISHSDPGQTRKAWQQQERHLLNLQEELRQIRSELPTLELAKNNTEKKYSAALNKQTKTKAIGEARSLLTSVEDTLTKIQGIVRTCARKDVERAMNDFYTPLLLKNYRVSLTDDFRYEIVDATNSKTIGASSSEVALATFAFVGAIAALMPSYARLERLLPAGDGKSVGSMRADKTNAYPVVLDAPYSPFGKEYSDQFSLALPDLLPQSVIIVREDQLEYVNAMLDSKRVGSAYVLQLHSGGVENKELVWQNNKYGYVLNIEGEEASHTKISTLPVG
jgi:DNA sulfur modification protein DndD